jgi:hypothetical protein
MITYFIITTWSTQSGSSFAINSGFIVNAADNRCCPAVVPESGSQDIELENFFQWKLIVSTVLLLFWLFLLFEIVFLFSLWPVVN